MKPSDPLLAGLKLCYQCRFDELPVSLRDCFVQLGRDDSLLQYVERARRARHGRLMTALHHSLRGYLSDFDINGLLGTYPMHVLGTEQWRYLLESAGVTQQSAGSLLDVGAGNGDVTVQLAPLFSSVVTTEMSWAMAFRLRRRGFECRRVDVTQAGALTERFDAVACLNVLDRCDRPLTLLSSLRTLLNDNGLFVLALVLPYQPFVYDGAVSRDPAERLPLRGQGWEALAGSLCQDVLEPLGLKIEALSRVPYLSGGDAKRTLYELDDVVVVCRALGKALLVSP